MNDLVKSIAEQMEINFENARVMLLTYDANALICGACAWRYAYHALHSCDRWLFNPSQYTQPDFHIGNMDNPDAPTDVTLDDEVLMNYLASVRAKARAYLASLTDEMLTEKPTDCEYSRLELILGQFRHLSFHIGMVNGITIGRTGKFPRFRGLENTHSTDLYE